MGFTRGEMILANLHYLPTAQCIPTNTILSGPLTKIIDDVSGAVGGLLFKAVIGMAVIIAVGLVFLVLSNRMAVWIRALAFVLAVPLVVILALIAFKAIYTSFNSSC